MKRILLSILATLVLIGVTLPMIGGSMAGFCDSETSYDNYIETADLDLKVNGDDDLDWGTGVGACIEIDDGKLCTSYDRTVALWNAGCAGGTAYLHIKNLVGPASLSQNLNVEIWYDSNWVTSQSINDLTCHQIELGELSENATKDVNMILHATAGAPGESLSFDIQFELLGGRFCDSEVSQGNYFGLHCEFGGSPGFWNGPGARNEYGETETEAKTQIVSWFREIVLFPYDNSSGSNWFTDVIITDDDDTDYITMQNILICSSGNDYADKVNKFRSQYLATRLNTMPDDPRLYLGTPHNIAMVPSDEGYIDASGYFGFGIGTLQQIITTIESKETDGLIFDPPPTQGNMLIMKDVCDALNNVKI